MKKWIVEKHKDLIEIGTEDGTLICTLKKSKENKINAKLIAAAPELLEACIAVMKGGYGCAPSVDFMDNLKMKCELAIKKATE